MVTGLDPVLRFGQGPGPHVPVSSRTASVSDLRPFLFMSPLDKNLLPTPNDQSVFLFTGKIEGVVNHETQLRYRRVDRGA